MPDPRTRNTRHLAKAPETKPLDFAGPKQEEAFRYGPFPTCLSGAFNSAKTVTFALKMLYIADQYPGYRWFVGRRIWDELRKTTMASFFKFCPRQAWEPNGRRSDTEKILQLNNGSEFIWFHLDDPDTLSIVRGLEINGFMLDQAEELDEEVFTVLMSRLGRWDKAEVPQAMLDFHALTSGGKPWPFIHPVTKRNMPPSYPLLTCNPDHELHWIYTRFHPDSPSHVEKRHMIGHDSPDCPNAQMDRLGGCKCGRLLIDGSWAHPGMRISYADMGYKMYEVSAYDNKYATRQTLQEMESQDETWKRRFLFGKWGIPEGQIHNVRESSMLKPSPEVLAHIQYRCTLHRAMDHGDEAPSCCLWFGTDADGNVFTYREYYMPNKLISEHRVNIYGLSRNERYLSNMADPAIFGPTMQKHGQRWSVAQEYADGVNHPLETVIYWERGDNDELGTRNKISEYLRPSGHWQMVNGEPVEVPRPHPITKEMGFWPRLYYVMKTQDYPNGCDHVVRQTKSARRLKLGTENGKPIFSDERDPKVPDHALDPERYFLASMPSLPHSIPKKYAANSFMGRRKAAIEYKKRFKNRLAMDAKRAAEARFG
jgi:hypothetical protein